MCTAYKCRAYPNTEQVSVLTRTFGCVRVVWNRTLAWRQARYRDGQATTSYAQASAYLTAMKADGDLGWLNEVSSVPLQQAIRRQQAAFASLFTWSWPHIDPASLDPTTVTVSRDPCGRWYVSFAVDVPEPAPLPPAGAVVGIDLGVKDFAVTTDGNKIPNPRSLARREHSLARYQRRLARCQNMIRNHSLAKAISDCCWGEFRRQLAYRAARAGRRLIVIDRFFPSSKTCSACGHLLAGLSLRTRAWQCPSCGTRHDRDINAAKNILAAGLAVTACGADVRHPGSSRVRSAVKQEPRRATAGIPVHPGGE